MTEINSKFLRIGRNRRYEEGIQKTSKGRKIIGKKGVPVKTATASAEIQPVVAACIISKNKVLLHRRTRGALKDMWEFPGDRVEPNETPSYALAREIKEELGFPIRVHGLIHNQTNTYPALDGRFQVSFYTCSLVLPPSKLVFYDSEWVNLKSITEYLTLPGTNEALAELYRLKYLR